MTATSETRVLLLLVTVTATLHQSEALDWRIRRDRILGIHRKKKGLKAGWKRTKTREFSKKGEKWEWGRIDLPADVGLRVDVKYRPKHCTSRSKSGDYLSVHYNGTLYSDGRLFDSSIQREEPFVFQIGNHEMNEGWEQGLLNMCIGEKRKLVVPSGMAYGTTNAHRSELLSKVQPDATVLGEEELALHLAWGL